MTVLSVHNDTQTFIVMALTCSLAQIFTFEKQTKDFEQETCFCMKSMVFCYLYELFWGMHLLFCKFQILIWEMYQSDWEKLWLSYSHNKGIIKAQDSNNNPTYFVKPRKIPSDKYTLDYMEILYGKFKNVPCTLKRMMCLYGLLFP